MSKIYDAAFAGGKSVNAMSAFDRGYYQATQGMGGSEPVSTVKNHYENQLRGYLKQLPPDMDLTTIPDKYQSNISNFLSQKKNEYVRHANVVDDLEVGTQDYMDTVSKMNNIKNTFTNLDKQFKIYGQSKKGVIDSIEGQTTSLYGENQANVNMLRGIFNEEYEMKIDDNGNLNFIGEDGEISLNDLPDFYEKDYKTADTMMTMGVNVYKNALKTGIPLKSGDIQYFQYKNKLKSIIDQSGNAGIMSILHDGLVGDVVMADDPMMKQMLQGYQNGDISFTELRDGVVDNYMSVLIKQSQTGASQRKVKASGTGAITSSSHYGPETAYDENNRRYIQRLPKDANTGPEIRYYEDGQRSLHYPDGRIETLAQGKNSNTSNSEPPTIDSATQLTVEEAKKRLKAKGILEPTPAEVFAEMKLK
jgi:acylphosphatase|tara:strand:+ start:83 stop:1339 length:1257 start_codon:yes stop_codon:yes gene_type:complete